MPKYNEFEVALQKSQLRSYALPTGGPRPVPSKETP